MPRVNAQSVAENDYQKRLALALMGGVKFKKNHQGTQVYIDTEEGPRVLSGASVELIEFMRAHPIDQLDNLQLLILAG